MSEDIKRLPLSDEELQSTNVAPDQADYDGDRKNDNKDVKHRRKLHGIITTPKRTAVVIGLNPSLANDQESDHTFTKTGRYLAQYGITDFYMLNLFDTVSPDPGDINTDDKTNWENYRKELDEAYIIVAAWGTTERKKAIREVEDSTLNFLRTNYKDKVYCVKDKETGKKPLHPRRYSYSDNLVRFFDD